jgi:transcriptional regulator with XRE-family HTH domain
MNLTQVEMARVLGVGQHTVSRYEKRADLLLSTIQGYVRAMGGRLALVAEFPNRRPVRIRQLEEVAENRLR